MAGGTGEIGQRGGQKEERSRCIIHANILIIQKILNERTAELQAEGQCENMELVIPVDRYRGERKEGGGNIKTTRKIFQHSMSGICLYEMNTLLMVH